MAPFVCCLRFEAVATRCHNIQPFAGASCTIPDAKKKDSIPIGQSHASLSHPEFFGGGCFVQLRQEQQNVKKNAQRKVVRSILRQYPFILIFSHPEKISRGKTHGFSPIDLGSWPRVYPIPSNWADPSRRNRCPQRSQSAPEDFWERQEIANVKNTRGGNLTHLPVAKFHQIAILSGRCRERAQVARSAGCF